MRVTAPRVRLELFGRTCAVLPDGRTVTNFGGVKPRQILQLLALSEGAPVSKDRLAEAIWHGAPPPSSTGTLESYVCLARRALGAQRGGFTPIRTTTQGYILDPAAVVVDLDEAVASLAPCRSGDPAQCVSRVARVLEQADAGLLADEPFAPWAREARQRFEARLVEAAAGAASLAVCTGDGQAAITLARQAIAREPLAESAWQALLRGLVLEGRRAEALQAYADVRRLLVDELGSDPSPETHAAYLEALQAPAAGGQQRSELAALMRLLRQALEDMPGVVAPASDAHLSQVAVALLSA